MVVMALLPLNESWEAPVAGELPAELNCVPSLQVTSQNDRRFAANSCGERHVDTNCQNNSVPLGTRERFTTQFVWNYTVPATDGRLMADEVGATIGAAVLATTAAD